MRPSLDEVMRQFVRFLDASWDAAAAIASRLTQVEAAELMPDWVQANWELLVETPLREHPGFGNANLEPYGEGADCNDSSSRVWNPDALPTHRLLCRAAAGAQMLDLLTGRSLDATEVPVVFDHFATKSARGWHEQASPFDCVHGYHGEQEVLIRLDEVSFVAERI